MPEFLVEKLARQLDERPDDPDALVFVGTDGAQLRRSNFSRRHWKPAVALAGLPSGLRFHDLRHTCVAFLISLGMQPYDVMRHLGHSSIKTTLDRYGHRFPNQDGERGRGWRCCIAILSRPCRGPSAARALSRSPAYEPKKGQRPFEWVREEREIPGQPHYS